MSVPSRVYEHPLDRQALDALRAIPLLDRLVKFYMQTFHEHHQKLLMQASAVKLGPNQLPRIHRKLEAACAVLGIRVPDLFLQMGSEPNAYAFGASDPFIVLTSELVEMMTEDELLAVIGHECGHIACGHVLYYSMATMLLQAGASTIPGLQAFGYPILAALSHWQRMSEFTADRAGAIVAGGHQPVVGTMLRLSGGPRSITAEVNMEAYLDQATALESQTLFDQFVLFQHQFRSSHPLTAYRASEIQKWTGGAEYQQILGGHYPLDGLPAKQIEGIFGGER